MPNLSDIRTFTLNNLDYSPTNSDFRAAIDGYINDQYFGIFTSKPYDFAQREVKIPVYADLTLSGTKAGGASTLITVPAGIPDWVEGQVLEVGGVEYEIVYKATATQILCEPALTSAIAASETITIKNRYIDLPFDCVSILNVMRRQLEITPQRVGRYVAVSRYEDEYYNLPLDEKNIPAYWIYADNAKLRAPRTVEATVIAGPAGSGARVVEAAQAFVYRGANEKYYRISGLSPAVSVSLTDAQKLEVKLQNTFLNEGWYRAVYFRSTENNLYHFRLLGVFEPGFTTQTFNLTAGELADNTFAQPEYKLFRNNDGLTKRIRLYPRQDEDYELTVRYVYRPDYLLEDADTPDLPSSAAMSIAFAVLEELSMMTDNTGRAGYYQAKKDQLIRELDTRHLTSPARRYIKRYMSEGLASPVPMYTNLRKLP